MRIIGLLFVAMMLVACGGESGSTGAKSETAVAMANATGTANAPTPTPAFCSTNDGSRASDLLDEFAREWDDANALAGSTPRMQLAGQVEKLQAIRRDVQDQEWPECGLLAQGYIITAMNAAIDGYIAFMRDESDSVVNGHFDDYDDALDDFAREMVLMDSQ